MPAEHYRARIERLAKAVRDEVDYVVVSRAVNIRYFTSLSIDPLERVVLLIVDSFTGDAYILAPMLERDRIAEVAKEIGLHLMVYSDYEDPVKKVSEVLSFGSTVGVEWAVKYGVVTSIKENCSVRGVVLVDDHISRLRMVKDEDELSKLRRASELNQEVIKYVIENLRSGKVEREVSLDACRYAMELGAESCPYPIIQSGPNTALPHKRSSDRVIRDGDIVLIDFTIIYDGYVSDITRTIVLGKGYERDAASIFDVVYRAQASALEAIKPGVAAKDIDLAARDTISREGYGDYFIHRTGHGIGLEVHEEPYIHEESTTIIEEGMVFTVEPGIYLLGRYGIRLEDNVIVTNDGYENLVQLPKSLDPRDYL